MNAMTTISTMLRAPKPVSFPAHFAAEKMGYRIPNDATKLFGEEDVQGYIRMGKRFMADVFVEGLDAPQNIDIGAGMFGTFHELINKEPPPSRGVVAQKTVQLFRLVFDGGLPYEIIPRHLVKHLGCSQNLAKVITQSLTTSIGMHACSLSSKKPKETARSLRNIVATTPHTTLVNRIARAALAEPHIHL